MSTWHPLLVICFLCSLQSVLGDSKANCKLDLQISSKNKSYDLTSVAYQAVNVSRAVDGRPAVATVQLCSDGPCPAAAAVCISATDAAGGLMVANAGRVDNDTALVVKDSLQLQLDLAPGQPCSDQGVNTTFQTTIHFICQSSTQGSEERLEALMMGSCSLLVVWYTPDACALPADAPPRCPLLSYRPYRRLPGLAALTAARLRAAAGGAVYQARLCGGAADDTCSGAPVCVTDPARDGGKPVSVGNISRPVRLAVTNGTVTLTYGEPGEDQAEVTMVCRESAGTGQLVFRRREQKVVQLDLETAVVCPMRQVDCQVTDADGGLRDLSPLIRTTSDWRTADRTGTQAGAHFYINMCRALNHDQLPQLCGGVAGTAVCMQSEGDSPVSLGRVADRPTLKPDGSLAIVYTNGSQCGADSSYSSEVLLVCGPENGQPVFLAREGACRYTFLWETAAACGAQESSGSDCRVRDPLYGHQLDVGSLRRSDTDYAIQLDHNRTLFVNLCGPLVRRCAGAADQGVCLVEDDKETSYGGATSRLRHSGGVLSLTMTGGAACGLAANHSTHVVLTCHQTAPAAAEPGLVQLGCVTYVVMPARQACPPRRTSSCRTPDGRFDLSGLTAPTGNHVYHEVNTSYVLNVCHSVNPEEGVNCPAEAGACLVRTGQPVAAYRYISLGAVSGGPAVEDGQLVLRYTSGQPCDGQPSRHRSTEVQFHCDPAAIGTQPRLISSDGCLYQFAWDSSQACPLQEVHGAANCTVQNPQTGYRFDLSPLARPSGYSVSLLGFQYQLNVCTALSQPGNCSTGTGVCKTTAVNPATKHNVGMANDRLVYDDGLLFLNYSGGAPCGGGRQYSTIVSFICGPEGGEPGPVVVEDDLCTVTVHWHTHLACETKVDCSVDTPAGLVDLTPLVRPGGTEAARPASGGPGGRVFTVNVCRPLGPAAGRVCPAASAGCLSDGAQFLGLGHGHTGPQQQSDHVTVTYEHGSRCPEDAGRNLTSELQLYCNATLPATGTRPDWPHYSDCRYTFHWETPAACPLSPAAAQAHRLCRVQRQDGTVADLNTLTAARPQQARYSDRTVILRPCQTARPCGGAVCVGTASYGGTASFEVRQPSGGLVMEYSAGSPCTRTDGGQATRGATLHLTCDPGVGHGTPKVTELTDCHVTVEWRSSAVCSAGRSGGSAADATPPTIHGTGHVVAWLLVLVVSAGLVAFLACRSRWGGCSGCRVCLLWDTLRRQLLSPGTRATAHYRPVRVEDSDEAETALLLDTPLEEQRSPRPSRRRPGQSPPPPDMTDVCLDPACDSDDELLIV